MSRAKKKLWQTIRIDREVGTTQMSLTVLHHFPIYRVEGVKRETSDLKPGVTLSPSTGGA